MPNPKPQGIFITHNRSPPKASRIPKTQKHHHVSSYHSKGDDRTMLRKKPVNESARGPPPPVGFRDVSDQNKFAPSRAPRRISVKKHRRIVEPNHRKLRRRRKRHVRQCHDDRSNQRHPTSDAREHRCSRSNPCRTAEQQPRARGQRRTPRYATIGPIRIAVRHPRAGILSTGISKLIRSCSCTSRVRAILPSMVSLMSILPASMLVM
jgi:hypothetical protein